MFNLDGPWLVDNNAKLPCAIIQRGSTLLVVPQYNAPLGLFLSAEGAILTGPSGEKNADDRRQVGTYDPKSDVIRWMPVLGAPFAGHEWYRASLLADLDKAVAKNRAALKKDRKK